MCAGVLSDLACLLLFDGGRKLWLTIIMMLGKRIPNIA